MRLLGGAMGGAEFIGELFENLSFLLKVVQSFPDLEFVNVRQVFRDPNHL